jgi:hypothetical protein
MSNIRKLRRTVLAALILAMSNAAFADIADVPECVHTRDTFDGAYPQHLGIPQSGHRNLTKDPDPLQFATVKGASGDRVAIRSRHPSLCANTPDKLCRQTSYVVPGDTVAVGHACSSWTYVQYIGKDSVCKGWVETAHIAPLTLSLPFDGGIPGGQDPKLYPNKWTVNVQLVKGRGVPVCEAYLQRIHQTLFYEPPFCGRPDNDQVPGFAHLRAVPLSPMQVNRFSVSQANLEAQLSLHYTERPDAMELAASAETKFVYLDTGGIIAAVPKNANVSVWRYEPPADIDNDGIPDNIVMWRSSGPPIWTPCGLVPFSDSGRQSGGPVTYVLSADSASIDVAKTVALFGDPRMQGPENQAWTPAGEYHPVGYSMGIFQYQGEYYFDAFVDHEITNSKSRRREFYQQRLYVFRRSAGKLERMCAFDNMDSEWDGQYE